MTFFEYPGATPGRAGEGMVHTIVWRVGGAAGARLLGRAPRRRGRRGRARRRAPAVRRPRGPRPRARRATRAATSRSPPSTRRSRPSIALQGFDGVRAYSADPERSAPLLERVLGATPAGDDTLGAARRAPRRRRSPTTPPPAEPGRQSAGTVHHVAWGTTVAEHPRWQERLREAGVHDPGIIDRHYFHSIYFREPSGVLFEIADDGPGFTVDVAARGARLEGDPAAAARALPRAASRRDLTPLPDPRAQRSPARYGSVVRRIAYSIGAPFWGAQPGNAPASCRRPASVIGSVDATQAMTRSPGT